MPAPKTEDSWKSYNKSCEKFLDLVHSDLHSSNCYTHKEEKYCQGICDHVTKWGWDRLLRKKSHGDNKFKELELRWRQQVGSDNRPSNLLCIKALSTHEEGTYTSYSSTCQSTIQHDKKMQTSWEPVHLAGRFLFHKFAGQLVTTPDGGNPFIQGPQGSQYRAQLQLQAESNFAWASMAHKLLLQAWQQGKLTGKEWANSNATVVQSCVASALVACACKVLGSGAISSSVSRANSSHSLDAAETASIAVCEQGHVFFSPHAGCK